MTIFTSKKHVFVFFMFSIVFTISAQKKPVRLIEEVQKKRTLLFIQNDSETEKSIFLKVNPNGYRKSAQRPVLQMIPPKSKTHVMTLIPLKNTVSHYTHTLIVNEELRNINGR